MIERSAKCGRGIKEGDSRRKGETLFLGQYLMKLVAEWKCQCTLYIDCTSKLRRCSYGYGPVELGWASMDTSVTGHKLEFRVVSYSKRG